MGRISSSVGLITNIPIEETVNKLISLQARSRDLVVDRNKTLDKQQVAFTELSALLLAFQFTTNNLGRTDLFRARSSTSSNPSLLTVTHTGEPPLGSYRFTPVRTVQSQQLLSSGLASSTTALGAGQMSLRFGGYVDEDTNLEVLNSGAGLTRGKLRITDRSGASAEIDLRFARTLDDVLQAVNTNSTINVRLEAHGDRLRLVDLTGQAVSNLKVQEVGSGTTAASLGLSGIDVAATQADGADVVKLFNGLDLNRLNGGMGVRFSSVLSDLQVTFRDGSSPLAIDFRKLAVPGTQARGTTTAANGVNAQLKFTAVNAGSDYDGVNVIFQNDNSVTAGSETVAYDDGTKTLTFKIDEGNTTADQVVAALENNDEVKLLFTAEEANGGNGTGIINGADTATLTGPQATATSPGTQGANARVLFTSVAAGAAFDDVAISFVDNGGITAGSETVVYDDSDPDNKTLIFQIDAGNTTAANIIDALNNDPTASQVFTAANASGSDGTGLIDVADTATTSGGAIVEPIPAGAEATIAGVLATINAADPARLQAELSADGDRIRLIDLTADTGGTFAVTAANNSRAAADLGLTGTAVGGVITSRRLFAGLGTTLLANLGGEAGLGDLGTVDLTDRNGATTSVDLSAAETFDDVMEAINAAGLGITARVNTARNGLLLTDTSGATASNLIVADGDATNTATKLNIAIDAAATSVNSGLLQRRVVSENTRLASLNGGAGVTKGTFTVYDTNGASRVIDLGLGTVETVGQVIDKINQAGLGVLARINDAGDGILLVDTAGGASTLRVAEGNTRTAADLRLLGEEETIDIGGTPTKVIDGSTTYTIDVSATDTLTTLVTKINDLGAGVTASVFNDGSGLSPFRLTLTSQRAGRAGQLLIEAGQTPLSFIETARAEDALLQFGTSSSGTGVLATSNTNTFKDVVPGVTLSLVAPSTDPVTVTIGTSDSSLVSGVIAAVDSFNRVRAKLADLTAFDAELNSKGPLLGDSALLRVETDLGNLLSGRFFGAGSIQSLETLGIKLKDDGTIELDQTLLKAKFAEDPAAVQAFFTTEEIGFSDRLKRAIEQMAGEDNSLLGGRLDSLTRKIDDNNARIGTMNDRLERQREQLLTKFARLELAVSKIQSNLTFLDGIGPLSTPQASSRTQS